MNADDFALNASCSNGIITAVKEGRLQATSVLAGGEDQVSYNALNEAGDVFINAHLNLLEGKP
ncbi:YdjC-like protein [Bartonella apihabitans]|uniref:YdjC-like protein n=2 Tax=Bartonella apihabitans TaxID=2750929 RepID=A0A1U9MBD0_9HYPH|nr:YdjC-like protein [Bartonella apihabitans]